ncbi:hypothetical protein Hjap01_00291 [Haloarcula japonica]
MYSLFSVLASVLASEPTRMTPGTDCLTTMYRWLVPLSNPLISLDRLSNACGL